MDSYLLQYTTKKRAFSLFAVLFLLAGSGVFSIEKNWHTDFSFGGGAVARLYHEDILSPGVVVQLESFFPHRRASFLLRLDLLYAAFPLQYEMKDGPFFLGGAEFGFRVYPWDVYELWFSPYLEGWGGAIIGLTGTPQAATDIIYGGGLGFRMSFSRNVFLELQMRAGMPLIVSGALILGVYSV